MKTINIKNKKIDDDVISISDQKVGSFSDIILEQMIFLHGRIYALSRVTPGNLTPTSSQIRA